MLLDLDSVVVSATLLLVSGPSADYEVWFCVIFEDFVVFCTRKQLPSPRPWQVIGNTKANSPKTRFTSKLLWRTTLLSDENWRKLVSPHRDLNYGDFRLVYHHNVSIFTLKLSQTGDGPYYGPYWTRIRFGDQILAGNYFLDLRKLTKTCGTD